MAPTLRDWTWSSAFGSGTSATVAVPDHAAGDLVVLTVGTQSGFFADTTPITASGFTQVAVDAYDLNGFSTTIAKAWVKVAGGSEPSSYTVSFGTQTPNYVITCATFESGTFDPDDPLADVAVTVDSDGGTPIVGAGVTAVDDALGYVVAAVLVNSSSSMSMSGGWTEVYDVNNSGFLSAAGYVRELNAGATGALSVTPDGSLEPGRGAIYALVIAPAGGGSGGDPQDVTGGHVATAVVLYPPTATAGPVTVTAAHLTSGAVLYTPAVSAGAGTVTGGHVASTAVLYPAAAVPGPVAVTGAHIASTVVLYAPTGQTGATSATGAHVAATAVLYPPAAAPGPVAVVAGHVASTAVLFAPSAAAGDVDAAGAHIASTAVLYAPTGVPGPVAAVAAHVASTVVLYAPAATVHGAVAGAHIASTVALFPPIGVPGPVAVVGGHVASTAVLSAPSGAPAPWAAAGAHVTSTVVLYPPAVTVGGVTVTAGHAASTAAMFPPVAVPGPVAVTGAHVASTVALFAPVAYIGALVQVGTAVSHLFGARAASTVEGTPAGAGATSTLVP